MTRTLIVTGLVVGLGLSQSACFMPNMWNIAAFTAAAVATEVTEDPNEPKYPLGESLDRAKTMQTLDPTAGKGEEAARPVEGLDGQAATALMKGYRKSFGASSSSSSSTSTSKKGGMQDLNDMVESLTGGAVSTDGGGSGGSGGSGGGTVK